MNCLFDSNSSVVDFCGLESARIVRSLSHPTGVHMANKHQKCYNYIFMNLE